MRALLIVITLFLAASPALAKEWTVDYTHSRLGFMGTQGSTPFDGEFKKFATHVDLDPAHPETGSIKAVIDTSSATAGSSERDSNLPQPDWFDVKKFPEATFVSTAIRQIGNHAYVANGDLTIKGVTRPVTLSFTLAPEGDHWRAQGKVPLVRTDFHLGTGEWANENYVKYAVDVVIDLQAKP